MKHVRNIHIIGTSHIAKDSVKKVKESFDILKPDILALELDPGRAYSLENNIKRPKNLILLKNLGLMGFLFFLFGEFLQKNLGKIVNIKPGAEMLTALKTARNKNIAIALIDRDIRITLRRFSKYFRKRELLKIIMDMIFGAFKKNSLGDVDLSKVPADNIIEIVLEQTKKRYPSLYKVLIEERDIYMARNLIHISENNPDKKIMAVVGAGHLNGMLNYMHKENFI